MRSPVCFSAQASFLASALLLPIGAASLMAARSPEQHDKRLLAAAPLCFSLQQACEGLIWLGLDAQPSEMAAASGLLEAPTLTYLFFAYAFWPVWMPLAAAALMPPAGWPSRLCRALPWLGLVPGILLWLPLLGDPRGALPQRVGHSLVYPLSERVEDLLAPLVGPALYASLIVLALLLVPSRRVRVFAFTLLLTFGLTEWSSRLALTSVWCFASALLSAQILWIIAELPADGELEPSPSLPLVRPIP
jgi:hypothetical protein